MAKTAYFEKLRDPRWQRKRLEVMQRDEFTCQSCFDSGSTLNVHHRVYIKGNEPWDYPVENLVTLCESCHSDEGQVSQAIHDFIVNVWPDYAFNTDTSRFKNLGAFIAVGKCGGRISPYHEEDWMACIGAITAIFAHEKEPKEIPLVVQLLDLFKAAATDLVKESAE